MLHISQLGKSNVRNVEDVVKKGETVTVYVLKVEPNSGRIALSLEKPPEKPISDLRVGDEVTGTVVRLESFGAFVDIGAERPGMIHVSELATDYIQKPDDVVNVGDEVKAKVIKVNRKKRQIDLSIKALEEEQIRETVAVADEGEDENMPTAMELALRRAMQDASDETAQSSEGGKGKQRDSRRKKQALEDALSRTLKRHSS
jgi:predicted RNA-binding protein with RPS1 domain